MKAVIIHDERLAIMHMKSLLAACGNVVESGTFTSVSAALEAMAELRPEIDFLHIDVPEMNGIQAAERLAGLFSGTGAIFVAAVDEDSDQPPSMKANGLKNAGEEPSTATARGARTMLCCMQLLHVRDADGRIRHLKWRTRKAQELFSYLLHNRKHYVRKETLLDLLWPDVPLKQAAAHLYTTIYQIRQTLKRERIEAEIAAFEDGYRLELGEVLLDVDLWEEKLKELAPVSGKNLDRHLEAIDFYSGEYLGDHPYLWAEGETIRLQNRWIRLVLQAAEHLEKCGNPRDAAAIYMKLQERLPYVEDSYTALMKLYAKQNARKQVEDQYNRLSRHYEDELLAPLPDEVQKWYSHWLSNGTF